MDSKSDATSDSKAEDSTERNILMKARIRDDNDVNHAISHGTPDMLEISFGPGAVKKSINASTSPLLVSSKHVIPSEVLLAFAK
jgi:hypothetical protein